MTARFVLDESSWATVTGTDPDALSNAIHRLLDRLDVTRERDEGVVKHEDFYETDLGDGVQLFSALFEPECQLQFDHDLSERLRLAMDRVANFSDSALADYDAEFGGGSRFSPGVAWAHARYSERYHIAVFPLSLAGVPVGPVGKVPISIWGITNEIYFVTKEAELLGFFRSVIDLENADEAKFELLAPSAFPALDWADELWRGLRDFSRPYVDVREELVRYLGGLNDHGADVSSCTVKGTRNTFLKFYQLGWGLRLQTRTVVPSGIDRLKKTEHGSIGE